MEMTSPKHVISPSALQNTSFTSLLMGVFLNSPLITSEHLSGFSSSRIFLKYGDPFLVALDQFGRLNALEQFDIIHNLQR